MIKSLEGGRGIAALIVALFHMTIGTPQLSLFSRGYLFVDLFFVLSGFVISGAYEKRLNTLVDGRSFFIRRFGRLFPLLVFSTVVYILAADSIVLAKRLAMAEGYTGALHNPGALDYLIPQPLEVLSTLTMTHGMNVFDTLILNTPSWSISTEFYTYLLFAAVCLTLRGRLRLLIFAFLSALGFVISIAASVNHYDCLHAGGCLSLTFDYGFPRTVFSFFLGALTFHAGRRLHLFPDVAQLIGVAALVVAFTLCGRIPGLAFSFPFIFAFLILSVSKDEGWFAVLLQSKPCQLLGERSYSIYMMHMPLVLFFEIAARHMNGLLANSLLLLVYVTVLVMISGLTYRYIEHPFRAMFNRLATRHTQTRLRSAES